MEYNLIYDSSVTSLEKEYSLNRERFDSPIVPVYVLFSQEGISLEADACGNAVFYALDGTEVSRQKADGQGKCFTTLRCQVCQGTITVRFLIQEEIDHYPHCDGEHDRYSYITRHEVAIRYNPAK